MEDSRVPHFTDGQGVCKTSMLEVVERIELFIWKLGSWPGKNFVNNWSNTTNRQLSIEDFVEIWYSWWFNGRAFVDTVVYGDNKPLFRYILKEYEGHFGRDIHFPQNSSQWTGDIQLEHIFPETPEDPKKQRNFKGYNASLLSG